MRHGPLSSRRGLEVGSQCQGFESKKGWWGGEQCDKQVTSKLVLFLLRQATGHTFKALGLSEQLLIVCLYLLRTA